MVAPNIFVPPIADVDYVSYNLFNKEETNVTWSWHLMQSLNI